MDNNQDHFSSVELPNTFSSKHKDNMDKYEEVKGIKSGDAEE